MQTKKTAAEGRAQAQSIGQRAEEIYHRDLKAKLLPAHRGEYLMIHADTGDYILGPDEDAVEQQALDRYGYGAPLYMKWVGYNAVNSMGGGRIEEED